MKNFEIDDIHETDLKNIELNICDAIDEYNDAVPTYSQHIPKPIEPKLYSTI